MFVVHRNKNNPIVSPDSTNSAESFAAFNGNPVKVGSHTHLVYRAVATPQPFEGGTFSLSTIHKASSKDGITFKDRKPFITPTEIWDRYGCEDPRTTKIGRNYYTFYTALSNFPFNAQGIKVAVAVSKDMNTVSEKHLVTPFNAKAMTLFPEKIKGKYTAILSVNTDMPPSKMAIAQFENLEDMWSEKFWNKWYKNVDKYTLNLKRKDDDQVEVGSTPIKTKYGWLLIYSHIQNYFSDHKVFGIEAVLLDKNNPQKVIGRTRGPMLVPEESYEKYGTVPNIVFPSGAVVEKNTLKIYYGGADTVCAVAEVKLDHLLNSLIEKEVVLRSPKNPILKPTKLSWENRAVFNPAAVDIGGHIQILYRAMSEDNTSTVGLAVSRNGISINQRLDQPIYVPREGFEGKGIPNGNSGCEDPRATRIGNRIYMTYTAYNGLQAPAVALSSISINDFKAHKWNWSKPVLVSPPGVDDKDACILPYTDGAIQYLIHRISNAIVISTINIEKPAPVKNQTVMMSARPGHWDSKKVGISSVPFLTQHGWLMLYHGVSDDGVYRMGAALLDKKDPTIILSRTADAIFEPIKDYELNGQVGNVVFPCGSVVREGIVYIYYGGGDSVTGVATASLKELLDILK